MLIKFYDIRETKINRKERERRYTTIMVVARPMLLISQCLAAFTL